MVQRYAFIFISPNIWLTFFEKCDIFYTYYDFGTASSPKSTPIHNVQEYTPIAASEKKVWSFHQQLLKVGPLRGPEVTCEACPFYKNSSFTIPCSLPLKQSIIQFTLKYSIHIFFFFIFYIKVSDYLILTQCKDTNNIENTQIHIAKSSKNTQIWMFELIWQRYNQKDAYLSSNVDVLFQDINLHLP